MNNEIKWLGHAAFQITTQKGLVILIDPWITGNPSCPFNVDELNPADIVLITHYHGDHVGNALELVKKEGGILVGQPEVVTKLKTMGLDSKNVVNGGLGMNIGGSVSVQNITITMTEAHHSSEVGTPAGYILTLEDGTVLYHAGDTSIFASMELIGDIYQPDLALLPIGNVFTMDPKQAAVALTLLKPKAVIPMHYGSSPILVQDEQEFCEMARESASKTEIITIKPGESTKI